MIGASRTFLALDGSGAMASVAIGRPGGRSVRAAVEERGVHAARLLPAIATLASEAGMTLRDIEGIVVGEGPGSFTGVRIAGATAKGLARALDAPLWAVSSLAAAAVGSGPGSDTEAGSVTAAGSATTVRYALFDARSDRVYGACYRVGPEGVCTLVEPHGGTVGEVLDADLPTDVVFVGAGAERHRAQLEAAGHRVAPDGSGEPTGAALLRFLEIQPDAPPVTDLSSWEPRYVRASNAEREWGG